MQTSDFNFILPPELIAQYPLANRSDSKLLVYERQTQQITHTQVKQLSDWFQPGDLLVLNDSKVMPARMFGRKESGGKVEILVERMLSPQIFLAHLKASKPFKPGQLIYISDQWQIKVESQQDALYQCSIEGNIRELLDAHGHMPLPPYIQRADELADQCRYQTVYAKHEGSIAAPTAGLHFDETLLNAIKSKGVNIVYTTLHVGAGTFKPVRAEHVSEHVMHSEWIEVSEATCSAVAETKGRVIAVGTTVVRALETAASSGVLKPFAGETQIFIYPGYRFRVIDGLMTNFHLPQSTLLMLVSAWIGREEVMKVYAEAIAKGYRFFSYGDVSLLI